MPTIGNSQISVDSELMPRNEILEIYDRLPRNLKLLFDAAPEVMNPKQFMELYRIYGPFAFDIIENFLQDRYPGWKYHA